jgi:hypothetical protein
MLAWVVVYRRHLRQSRESRLPRALGAKFAIRLSRSASFISFISSTSLTSFTPSLPYLKIALPSRPYPSSPLPTIALSPLAATLTKNRGRGQSGAIVHPTVHSTLPPILRTLFQVPYPATPLFATLGKTAGCVPIIPVLELGLCARQPYPLLPIPYLLSIPRLVVSCG